MPVFTFWEIVVAAALIAKVLLVLDHLPWIDLFRKRPLIANVLWKTSLYWCVTFLIRLLIRFHPYLFSGERFLIRIVHFFNDMNWSYFVAVQSFYLMVYCIFVTARELIVQIGPKKLRKVFFGF
ncbi:MAG: hypothetical protein HY069_01640 [Chlamydiia bacterium]|nr:hypothetical protein [Chlamydiia bacterium]